MLKKGKRYYWYPILLGFTNTPQGKLLSGLFTGEYDKNNNAIFLTRWGDVWAIPEKYVLERNQVDGNYKTR